MRRKVKITVVKKLDMNEIHGEAKAGVTPKIVPVCEVFEEGQEFLSSDARSFS